MSKKQIETIIYMEILESINRCYGSYEANNPCYDIDLIASDIVDKLEKENVLKEDK